MNAGSTLVRAKRPVRLVEPGEATKPRPPSFDRDSAREAWRQFARNRGAVRGGGMEPERRSSWLWTIVLGATIGVVAWTFLDRGSSAPPVAPEPEAEVAAAAPLVALPEAPKETRRPRSSSGFTAEATRLARRPAPRAPLASLPAADEPTHDARRRRAQIATNRRIAPEGLEADSAEAFRKVPRATSDRPPLGDVSKTGLHVDRIGVGTAYQRGICDGPPEGVFSVRAHGQAHVCFRAVHLRRREKVVVHWEKDGQLVKRTHVRIPARHAYRTRAGIGLRKAFVGHWDVRVMSLDGVELAHDQFDVVN